MGFGGIFNSFKFEQGRSEPEPIRGERGDQNGDFGFGCEAARRGFFNFPPRQLFLNYSGHKLKTPTSEDLDHHFALSKSEISICEKFRPNFSPYSIKLWISYSVKSQSIESEKQFILLTFAPLTWNTPHSQLTFEDIHFQLFCLEIQTWFLSDPSQNLWVPRLNWWCQ